MLGLFFFRIYKPDTFSEWRTNWRRVVAGRGIKVLPGSFTLIQSRYSDSDPSSLMHIVGEQRTENERRALDGTIRWRRVV